MESTFLGRSSNSLIKFIVRILFIAFIAVVAFQARRRWIAQLFVDAPPMEAVLLSPAEGHDLSYWSKNRVLILDGLDLETADGLENLGRICDQGLRLIVDVGFPTVSLPVQHVLWTGLTQQQSGIQYRISALDAPPANAIPQQVPGSVAIVQDHLEIVRSFGFSQVIPDVPMVESFWKQTEFFEKSRTLTSHNSALLLIHVLSIDAAGHRWGKNSIQYLEEARRVDRWLGDLDFDANSDRLFILSDHGHRPSGGHGGSEPALRMVRACVVGPGIEADSRARPIHLVDLSRALSKALGLNIDPRSQGRPLFTNSTLDNANSTLPRVSHRSLFMVLLWVLGGAWVSYRNRPTFPYCLLLAVLGAQIVSGPISLSCPAIYPPWGLKLLQGTWPGILVFGVRSWQWLQRRPVIVYSELAIGCWLVGLLVLVCLDYNHSHGIVMRWLPYYGANLMVMLWLTSALASISVVAALLGWVLQSNKKATR